MRIPIAASRTTAPFVPPSSDSGARFQWVRRSLQNAEGSRVELLAGATGIVCGAIHVALGPSHLEETLGEGLFFLFLGSLQIIWGLWFLSRTTVAGLGAGIVLATASLTIYAAVVTIRLPFVDAREEIDEVGLFTKLIELATIFLLVLLVARPLKAPSAPRFAFFPVVGLSLLIGVAAGAATYGGGIVAAEVVPELGEPGTHHHTEVTENHSHARQGGIPDAGPILLVPTWAQCPQRPIEWPASDPWLGCPNRRGLHAS